MDTVTDHGSFGEDSTVDGTEEFAWLRRSDGPISDRRVGPVVREYRLARGLKQAAVARDLGITQQFLSQVETGARNLTLDQRQGFARVLGIPAEELGLADRRRGGPVPRETTAAVAASRGRWRVQRQWLNQHRAELGNMAVEWHARENQVARTALITGDDWLPDCPVELGSVRLRLDERPQPAYLTGAESVTDAMRRNRW